MKTILLVFGFLVVAVTGDALPTNEDLWKNSLQFENDFYSIQSRGRLENKLLAAAESIRTTLREGGNLFNLTNGEVMDPWNLENVDADFELPEIAKLKGTFANVTVDGLSSFTINRVKVNIVLMKCDFDITFDHLLARGLYDIDGKIADLAKFYGKGPFDVKLHSINAAGYVKLYLKGLSSLQISEFKLVPSVGSMNIQLDGLMNNPNLSDMVNEVLNDALSELLVKHKNEISKEIDKLVQNLANPFLAGLSFQELINLLTGGV